MFLLLFFQRTILSIPEGDLAVLKNINFCYCFHRFTSHEYCKANSYEKVVDQICNMSTSDYFLKMETYNLTVSNLIAFMKLCFSLQYTTQRVYSKRDLFKTLTFMNIARDHHNRIIDRFIIFIAQ